jgi:type IV pilus assembly protein PilY1
VKVCDPGASAGGVEANCVAYGSNWKPEGLIQKYSSRMRFSVFGYLNDSGTGRNGAPMRARMKFVGPQKLDPTLGWVTNGNREWDASTGVMVINPDATDASNTTGTSPSITNSGVMNYLNKFGSMTNTNHKSNDPVSEMYYAALRYLRNQGNVAEYTNLSGTAATAYSQADGFPVISSWSPDPIEYYCQNLSILGIGDVYTWSDKNVPGSTSSTGEGTIVTDPDIDAGLWLNRISQLEFGDTTSLATPFQGTGGGRDNSAYIAALAYWAHTTDIRTQTAMKGKQTVSTYWVDVRENRRLEARRGNQYWLAAKYGGFVVPEDYDPATPAAWQTNWWNGTGETLTSSTTGAGAFYASETMGRPDNFYVGDQADKMVESLTRAFAKIASERAGSGSSLAANSTRLDTNTRVYQAQFRNGSWFGQINAYSINTDGSLSASPVWRAGSDSSLAPANWASRNIFTFNPSTSTYATFRNTNLSTAQKAQLTFTGIGSLTSADVVDYLRGNQAKEESFAGGTLRTRTPPEASWSVLLGDIVNSTPIYVGAPNSQLYSTAPAFTGKSVYETFATAQAGRTPALWVGSNDGMMHAFNANTGAEIYAYVPSVAIMNALGQYANPDYVHKYFVDGEVAIADIYNGSAWRTVMVGTLGRGGPGLFALDITNPASPTFLWEKTGAQIPVLGRNIGRPVIAQVADGDWRVILGNGVDSTAGNSHLITVGVTSGTVTTIDSGYTGGSNGMTSVLARDTNGDGFADTAYAGDLKGNLWKFTAISGSGSASKLYSARDPSNVAQPITAAPLVGRDPSTGAVWVFFGTGKYLGTGDVSDTQVQTWYAIKDNGTTGVVGRSTLVARVATAGVTLGDFPTRIITTGTAAEVAGMQGWYLDLPISKERMVAPNRFQGGALIGTSRIPDSSDVCAPGGSGYIMAVNPFTGGRLEQTFFDTNRDGLFNNADKSASTIVSGVGLDSMPNAPIFIENVALISLTSGETESLRVQGSSVDASRMSWREIMN